MDPLSVLGIASSIVGIVDLISHSLVGLSNLRRRFTEADVALKSIVAELSTTRAALQQLRLWIEHDDEPFQLTMDLETSLSSCHLLVSIIDDKISSAWNDGMDGISIQTKLKIALDDKEITSYLERLSRQIVALNLLVSVLKLPSPKRQVAELRKKTNRQILDQVKDDAFSLVVLCDSASLATSHTMTTTTTSKLSLLFPELDAELLATDVYQKAFRRLMRRANVNDKRTDTVPHPYVESFSTRSPLPQTQDSFPIPSFSSSHRVVESAGQDRNLEENLKRMSLDIGFIESGYILDAIYSHDIALGILGMQELMASPIRHPSTRSSESIPWRTKGAFEVWRRTSWAKQENWMEPEDWAGRVDLAKLGAFARQGDWTEPELRSLFPPTREIFKEIDPQKELKHQMRYSEIKGFRYTF